MRARFVVAATVGATAAALAHVLDTTGRLPFVSESASVRLAMSPELVVCWLAAAGALAALATATRVMAVGAPAAVAVSAFPELVGRHDIGALAEPGALLGAALQLLLLVTVVAIAAAAERRLRPLSVVAPARPPTRRALPRRDSVLVRLVDATAVPRAPPWCPRTEPPPPMRGRACPHHPGVASSRPR